MAKNKIYDQHDAAFNSVSAYVVMKDNERVATIAFKFPKDGAGRLYCYLHVLGLPMVRGMAGGYGYDKKSAAFEYASQKQAEVKLEDWQTEGEYNELYDIAHAMRDSFNDRGGHDWDANLRHAGFIVLQAV